MWRFVIRRTKERNRSYERMIDKDTLLKELNKRINFQLKTLNRLENDINKSETHRLKTLSQVYYVFLTLYSQTVETLMRMKGNKLEDLERNEEYKRRIKELLG